VEETSGRGATMTPPGDVCSDRPAPPASAASAAAEAMASTSNVDDSTQQDIN